MTSENIFEGVSFIESEFIDSSAAILKRRRSGRRAELTQRAACIAAAVVLVFGGLMIAFNVMRAGMTSDNEVPPLMLAEIDGARYLREGFHTGDIRKAYGLPEPSAAVKGEYLGSYIAGYEGSEDSGCFDFYALNVDVKGSVLLGERDGELRYWLRVFGGLDDFYSVSERLEHYGYGSAADVHSVQVNDISVENEENIAVLWDILASGGEMTVEDYRSITGASEPPKQTALISDSGGVRRYHDAEIRLNYGEGNFCAFSVRVRLDEAG